jgi:hypothetical protein
MRETTRTVKCMVRGNRPYVMVQFMKEDSSTGSSQAKASKHVFPSGSMYEGEWYGWTVCSTERGDLLM